MGSVKCFDVADMVIKEAVVRFGDLWKMNAERLDIFKSYCKAIDSLADEFSGMAYNLEIDDNTKTIAIELECDEIIIESEKHVFCELIDRAIEFGFSASEEGNLLVKFVFPSLWERS